MHIPAPRRPLHLNPLPYQIQRKRARLGHHARNRPRHRAPGAKRQVQLGQPRPQRLVHGEKAPHVRHNLRQPGPQPAEEPLDAFLPPDLDDRPPQAGVHLVVALGREARAQQVERVGGCRGGGAADGARDEGFGCRREGALAEGGMEEDGRRAVGGELDCAVADVEELRGHVALPETRHALVPEDVAEGGERAFVDGSALGGGVGEGVGEGVGLELEADFDYVEGGDDEASGRESWLVGC